MNDLYLKAILAGLFFGVWPLLMNRSGLRGNVASAALCLVALIVIMPFALKSIDGFPAANWLVVVGAGLFCGIGFLFFNGMLAKATPEKVGILFIIMLVAQMATPAIYQVIKDGGLTISKGLGFAAAIATVLLLSKS